MFRVVIEIQTWQGHIKNGRVATKNVSSGEEKLRKSPGETACVSSVSSRAGGYGFLIKKWLFGISREIINSGNEFLPQRHGDTEIRCVFSLCLRVSVVESRGLPESLNIFFQRLGCFGNASSKFPKLSEYTCFGNSASLHSRNNLFKENY